VENVYDAVRGIMGDTQVPGGEIYTDTLLQTHYQAAYSEMYRAAQSAQYPLVRRESYYNLPANTGYLNPATAFIYNLGQPESVEARINVTAWSVSSFSPTTPGLGFATLTTSIPTTLNSGNQAVLYGLAGVSDDANDQWTVTVTNPSTIVLNGCASIAVGTPVTTTAVLSSSAEQFNALTPVERLSWEDVAPVDRPLFYAWEGNVFRFPPCSGIVQLRIVYSLSGNAPTIITQPVGVDDCLGFLSYRTASLAALSRSLVQRASVYENLSVGPNWLSQQIPGGMLAQLLSPAIRNLQRLPPSKRRSPPFGRIRNRRWYAW